MPGQVGGLFGPERFGVGEGVVLDLVLRVGGHSGCAAEWSAMATQWDWEAYFTTDVEYLLGLFLGQLNFMCSSCGTYSSLVQLLAWVDVISCVL